MSVLHGQVAGFAVHLSYHASLIIISISRIPGMRRVHISCIVERMDLMGINMMRVAVA